MDTTEIKGIIRNYYKQVGKFRRNGQNVDRQSLSKLCYEFWASAPITRTDLIKNLDVPKREKPNDSMMNSELSSN